MVQLWDTAGQEKQNSIAKNFYRNSECCILVFDLTDVKSFEEIDEWRKEYLNQLQPKDPETFPFVLLGNKYDKTNEIKVTQTKIDMYCQAHNNMPYFNTSAKEDINVDKAFEDVARLAFQRNLKNDIVFQPTKVKLVRQSTVQTKVCCVQVIKLQLLVPKNTMLK